MNNEDIARLKNRLQLMKEAVIQANNNSDTIPDFIGGYFVAITDVEKIIDEEIEISKAIQ